MTERFAYIRILENFIGALSLRGVWRTAFKAPIHQVCCLYSAAKSFFLLRFAGVFAFAIIEVIVAPTSAHRDLRVQVARNVALCGQAVSTIWQAVPLGGGGARASSTTDDPAEAELHSAAAAAAASAVASAVGALSPLSPARRRRRADRAALLAASEATIAAFASGLARLRSLEEEADAEPNFLRHHAVPAEIYGSLDFHGRKLRRLLGLMQASIRQVYDDEEEDSGAAGSGGGGGSPGDAARAFKERGRRVRSVLGPSLQVLYERLDRLFAAMAAAAAVTTGDPPAAGPARQPAVGGVAEGGGRRPEPSAAAHPPPHSLREVAQAALTAAAEAQEAAEAALDDVVVRYSAVMLELRLEHAAAAADAALAEDGGGVSGGCNVVPNSTVVPVHAVVFFSRELLKHTAGLSHAIGQLVLVETMPPQW